MHLTPDFTTPGHDSDLKYFIICLLNSDIPFRFSYFFENGAFRIYGTFCGKFLSRDLHQNNCFFNERVVFQIFCVKEIFFINPCEFPPLTTSLVILGEKMIKPHSNL